MGSICVSLRNPTRLASSSCRLGRSGYREAQAHSYPQTLEGKRNSAARNKIRVPEHGRQRLETPLEGATNQTTQALLGEPLPAEVSLSPESFLSV